MQDIEKEFPGRWPIVMMARLLGVSASGWYAWRKRPMSATAIRRAELCDAIRAIFIDSNETYGYRRVHAVLERSGISACREYVRQLMADMGLVCKHEQRKRRSLTIQDPFAEDVPDLVRRDFTAAQLGIKFVGDITYIRTLEGWLYLATVLDCCSKRVVGYSMDDNYKTPLIIAAIESARKNTTVEPKAIFHSDRGSNYMSDDFNKHLKSVDMRHSVGRTGICYDNAMAESFFSMLKVELINRRVFATRDEARRELVKYIELWYNRRRLHSAIGYRTPHEVEVELKADSKSAA